MTRRPSPSTFSAQVFPLALIIAFTVSTFVPQQSHASPDNGIWPRDGVTFLENRGRVTDTDGRLRDDVLFTSRSNGVQLFFLKDRICYVFHKDASKHHDAARDVSLLRPLQDNARAVFHTLRMDMVLIGANARAQVRAEGATDIVTHIYTGQTPGGITGLRSFERLVYENIFDNIDLVFYSTSAGLKYDFIVRPGGDPSAIRFRYEGASSVAPNDAGGLTIVNPLGELREGKPLASLAGDGKSAQAAGAPPACAFRIQEGVVSFSMSSHDASATLTIDPTLHWGTYFGGANYERATGLRTFVNGDVVVCGNTFSSTLVATPGTIQTTNAGDLDVFIARFSNTGAMLWYTLYGGAMNDEATSVAIDIAGNPVITGSTLSPNFPVTPGAFQTAWAGGDDPFVLKLTSAGIRLWSTFFGGSTDDQASSIAVNGGGDIAITGWTNSSNFPVTPSASQPSIAGSSDVFVALLTASGGRVWATYHGGIYSEGGEGIAFDNGGNVVITGETFSPNFPISAGAFQTVHHGSNDAFLAKYDAVGAVLWSTLFGGAGNDISRSIAVDDSNQIVFAGVTTSSDLPVPPSAFLASLTGGEDAFLAAFAPDGARRWATYYGGVLNDGAFALGTDRLRNIVFTGQTYSPNFPVSPGALYPSKSGTADAVVVKFAPGGTRLWSTFYGGSFDESADATAVQYSGNVFLAGWTTSSNLPIQSAFQPANAGNFDAYVTKLCDAKPFVRADRSTNLCPGDSVILDAGPWYASWTWQRNGVLFATTPTIKIGNAGRYVVTVTDGLGCTGISDTIVVNVAPLLLADAGPNQSICAGSSTVIGQPATGGALPLRYRWTPVAGLTDSTAAQPSASPSGTTTYTVCVTDAYGCTSNASMLLTVFLQPQVNAGKDTILCSGAGATIGNPATGGTPGYRYSWSPAAGLSSAIVAQPYASPSVTTQYVVTAMDRSGCAAHDTVLVTIDHIAVDAGPDRAVCSGDSVKIGTLAVNGIGAVTYSWTPATGLSSTTTAQPFAFPTSNTMYHVTATDSRGCVAVDSVAVLVFSSLQSYAGPDVTVCRGSIIVIGDTAVCGVPPYTYAWTPSTGLSSATAARPSAQPTGTTTYHVTVTDATMATSIDSVVVTVFPTPSVDAGADEIICRGAEVLIGNAASGGTGPYSYAWTPSAGLSSASIAQPLASPSSTTRYRVTVTDANGCQAMDSVLVSISSLAVSLGQDLLLCLGDTIRIGNIATGGIPPYSYVWNPPTGLDSSTIARPRARPTVPSVYVVTVTDWAGCAASDTLAINVTPKPIANAGRDTTICRYETALIGNLAVSGTAPYTYSWSPVTGLSNPLIAKPLARPTSSTSYILTVTDSKGCRAKDTVLVTVRAYPSITGLKDTVVCRGDSIRIPTVVVGGRPPYIYTWTPRAGLSDTAAARPYAKPFFSTTYNLVVTDANGCQSFASMNVIAEPHPLPRIKVLGPLVFCEGGSVVLDADSTLLYQAYRWYRNDTLVGTTRQITATMTGLYKANVISTGGCTGESNAVNVIVIPRPWPRVTESGPLTFCEGGSITLESDSTNFWTYKWSTGETTRKIRVSRSGDYYVTATDPYGCKGTSPVFPVIVYDKPRPVITADGELSFCRGDSVVLDGGSGYASYHWSTGATTQTIVVKVSGSYTVTVTNENQCVGTSTAVTVAVVAPPQPNISAGGPLSFCEGGNVTLDAGAGFASYMWSTGAQTRQITVSSAGTFTVTVTNSSGCIGTSSPVTTLVKPRPRPIVTPIGSTAFCAGDSVQLDAGAGYTSYVWSTGSRKQIITVKNAGNYSVTVTNSNSCSAQSAAVAVTVWVKPNPQITHSGSFSFCPGDSVILDGGSGYSSYVWSTGARTRSIIVKSTGTFTVTVTNQFGCAGTSAPVATTRYDAPRPTITPGGPLTFCDGGSVSLDAGSGWTTYLWSTGARTRRITVTQAGLYNVTVTNPNGCKGESDIVSVKVNPLPPTPVITRNGNTLTSTQASAYQWNLNAVPIPGATSRSYTPTKSGQYSVSITDDNGCSSISAPFAFSVTSIDEEPSVQQFMVYPDPNVGYVVVDARFAQPVDAVVELTNVLGQNLEQKQYLGVRSISATFNTANLAPGVYLIHLRTNHQHITRRIVRQ
jgi:hypothetical protein